MEEKDCLDKRNKPPTPTQLIQAMFVVIHAIVSLSCKKRKFLWIAWNLLHKVYYLQSMLMITKFYYVNHLENKAILASFSQCGKDMSARIVLLSLRVDE